MTTIETLDMHINRAYWEDPATYRVLMDLKAVLVAEMEKRP